MNSPMIVFSCLLLVSSCLAQLPNGFFSGFGGSLPGSFGGFSSQQQQQVPTPGNGRASTGNMPGGPVLFPVSPEGGETSGVVVGASGYGFIPPGVRDLVQSGRGGSQPTSFSSSFSQPFPSNFFNFS